MVACRNQYVDPPGWFYHADEDGKVRSPENLVRYFDTSVARGTNMNLNLPPDRRGRIPDHDVAVLQSFGDAIRASFAIDLAKVPRPLPAHRVALGSSRRAYSTASRTATGPRRTMSPRRR